MSLIRADARALPLADGVVHCCVTSPPYYGLRDYGVAGQLGLEATPAAYLAALVAVFREVWRVLRDDGTCWVNVGDSFAGSDAVSGWRQGDRENTRNGAHVNRNGVGAVAGAKAKDLLMIPARRALALQADGWYLRSDIIWAKPNPMPESVTDRPTKSYEHLFLLTKAARYYYDAGAIAEACVYPGDHGFLRGPIDGCDSPDIAWRARSQQTRKVAGVDSYTAGKETRNKRDVWTIPTQCYDGAHFATMPEALVEPCILAGCPPGGMVLDPFCGSGTVGAVAARLGRRWVGTDLTYQTLAAERTAQRGLVFEAVS
jgi:DNA modification methylase